MTLLPVFLAVWPYFAQTALGSPLVLPPRSRNIDSLLNLARSMPKPVEIRLPPGVLELEATVRLDQRDSGLVLSGAPEGTLVLGSRLATWTSIRSQTQVLSRLNLTLPATLASTHSGGATPWTWALFDSAGLMLPTQDPSPGWNIDPLRDRTLGDSDLVQGFFGNDYQDRILEWGSAKTQLPKRIRRIASRHGLARPGTWAIDSGSVLANARGTIRITEMRAILTMDSSVDVTIRDLAFAQSLNGIRITSGRRIRLTNVTVRDVSGQGVDVVGGEDVSIDSSKVFRTGAGGIRIGGGDRARLRSCRHRVNRTSVDSFGQWNMAYNPAISVWGIGVSIVASSIRHGPHSGILVAGNDHQVSDCVLSDLLRETRDAGAIYMGRDLSARGNRIEGNIISDVRGFQGRGGIAIYLDDLASGVEVRRNVIRGADIGVLIGGGSWNHLEENSLEETRTRIYHDCRGSTWASDLASKRSQWNLIGKMKATIAGEDSLWVSRYGTLVPPRSSRGGFLSVGNTIVAGGARSDLSSSPACLVDKQESRE